MRLLRRLLLWGTRAGGGGVTPELGVPTVPTPRVAVSSINPLVTAAFPVPANSLLFVGFETRASATLAASTITDSLTTSWSLLIDESHDAGSGVRARQRVYCAAFEDAVESMTVTHSNAASIRKTTHLISITGTTAIPTNFDGTAGGNGNPSTLLPIAPAATSTLLGFFGGTAAAELTMDPPAGFTELEDLYDANGQMQVQTSYDAGGGAATNAWTSLAAVTVASVIEIPLPA